MAAASMGWARSLDDGDDDGLGDPRMEDSFHHCQMLPEGKLCRRFFCIPSFSVARGLRNNMMLKMDNAAPFSLPSLLVRRARRSVECEIGKHAVF